MAAFVEEIIHSQILLPKQATENDRNDQRFLFQ